MRERDRDPRVGVGVGGPLDEEVVLVQSDRGEVGDDKRVEVLGWAAAGGRKGEREEVGGRIHSPVRAVELVDKVRQEWLIVVHRTLVEEMRDVGFHRLALFHDDYLELWAPEGIRVELQKSPEVRQSPSHAHVDVGT